MKYCVTLQERMNSGDLGQMFNPRLSISSRFLSRAQQQHLRYVKYTRGQYGTLRWGLFFWR